MFAMYRPFRPSDGGASVGGFVQSERLHEYQYNVIFVGFTLFICSSAIVYLTQNLSSVLVPLIWAAFTAVPLTGLISVINPFIIRCTSICCGHAQGKKSIPFTILGGEIFVRIRRDKGRTLLDEVNAPGSDICGRCMEAERAYCCRRRVRVKELKAKDPADQDLLPKREVNRLVKGWKYYVQKAKERPANSNEVFLDLSLDHAAHYPAMVTPTADMPTLQGLLEIDKTHFVSYTVAVVVALSFIGCCLAVFIWLVSCGVEALTKNVSAYVKGGREFIDWGIGYAQEVLPPDLASKLDQHAQAQLQEKLPELASSILGLVEGIGFETLIYLLYLLFWTLEPLPVNSDVAALFKTYLLQKSLVCLMFAFSVSMLLLSLECPLWHILFLVAFLLNYIPEVGPIVCFFIMLPLILLDGNLPMERRSWNSLVFFVMFAVLKFLTGNIIEVALYAKSGGDLMRMHPVVMMALMMLFQAMMGITGMFMTVPAMAAAKYYMLSMNMPPAVLDPLLMCIEGTEQGPHMNFVEQQRASQEKEPDSDELESEYDEEEEDDLEQELQDKSRNLQENGHR